MPTDRILIVGQGICGTVLSSLCYQNKIPFLLVDNHFKNSASIPAAGILNPIVFKRMLPGWRVNELFPHAVSYYKMMEGLLQAKFFHSSGIIKIISNINEQALWNKGKENPALFSFLNNEKPTFPHLEPLLNNHYSLEQISAGAWVDAPLFLNKWRSFLVNQNLISEEKFHYQQLVFSTNNEPIYNNAKFKSIIFCEGNGITENPWFGHYPWVPTKGDLLLIEPKKSIPTKNIINRNGFLLPLNENNQWLAGSTYHWNDKSPLPSEKAKDEIIEKIKKMIAVDFTIVNHWSGIRPGVADRRPVIGSHPKNNHLQLFNGMGTKGFLLAPGLANEFLLQQTIHPDCNNARFEKS
jgi:glycine/D-amino acid oxidase-like deaminating enzyme